MKLTDLLIGHRVERASWATNTLVLDNGVRLKFARENTECCSHVELLALRETDNIITSAEFRNSDGGEDDEYRTWIHVLTNSGEVAIAEASVDPGSGYYLYGFALDVSVVFPYWSHE